MTDSPLAYVRAWLAKTPVVLPRYLDNFSEWWWSQPSRLRLVLPGVIVLCLAAAIGVNMTRDDTTVVLVATRDIAPGTLITQHDVTTQRRPRRFVPDAYTQNTDGVTLSVIPAGSVLTRHHLGDGGASVRLPQGRVAVASHATFFPRSR